MKIHTKTTKEELLAKLKTIEENETKTRHILTEQLPALRIQLLECLTILDECEVNDDYVAGIMVILKKVGEKGIALSRLRQIFPDTERLSAARKLLRESRSTKEDNDKPAVTIWFLRDYVPSETAGASAS